MFGLVGSYGHQEIYITHTRILRLYDTVGIIVDIRWALA